MLPSAFFHVRTVACPLGKKQLANAISMNERLNYQYPFCKSVAVTVSCDAIVPSWQRHWKRSRPEIDADYNQQRAEQLALACRSDVLAMSRWMSLLSCYRMLSFPTIYSSRSLESDQLACMAARRLPQCIHKRRLLCLPWARTTNHGSLRPVNQLDTCRHVRAIWTAWFQQRIIVLLSKTLPISRRSLHGSESANQLQLWGRR